MTLENMDCCYTNTTKELLKTSLEIKNTLYRFSEREIRDMFYGYAMSSEELEKIDKLNTYSKILQKHITELRLSQADRVLDGCSYKTMYEPCLDCEEVQSLIEKIKSITGKRCSTEYSDMHVDITQEDIWILNNPNCVAYEEWEKWSKLKYSSLGLTLESQDVTESLMLELSVQSITDDIVLTLAAVCEANDLGLKLRVKTEPELMAELRLILEEVPNADIDLNHYEKLYENNISFDAVKEVYMSGLEFEVASVNNKETIKLKTPVRSYSLESMRTTDKLNNTILQSYK